MLKFSIILIRRHQSLFRNTSASTNGLYIMDILKLCSVVMLTSITAEDNSQEDDDLIYAGEYLNIAKSPKTDYTNRLKARRLICRVCRLKFRSRQDTQAHIRREHRRVQVNV